MYRRWTQVGEQAAFAKNVLDIDLLFCFERERVKPKNQRHMLDFWRVNIGDGLAKCLSEFRHVEPRLHPLPKKLMYTLFEGEAGGLSTYY